MIPLRGYKKMASNWFQKKYWKVKFGPLSYKLNHRCFSVRKLHYMYVCIYMNVRSSDKVAKDWYIKFHKSNESFLLLKNMLGKTEEKKWLLQNNWLYVLYQKQKILLIHFKLTCPLHIIWEPLKPSSFWYF